MKVIISGLIASYPMGGMSWHYLQYLLGFKNLGFDVLYIEDTGQWSYDPRVQSFTEDPKYNILYLSSLLKKYDLNDSWSYRDVNGNYYGVCRESVLNAFRNADLFVNVSGSCWYRPEYQECKKSVYLDTDPGYNQIKVAKLLEGEEDQDLKYSVDRMADHQYHFSFGENIGRNGCLLRTDRFNWQATRQPIVLDLWWPNHMMPQKKYTTVMSWSPYNEPIAFQGRQYFGKENHLESVISLPKRNNISMELAMSGEPPYDHLKENGWNVIDARKISMDAEVYRDYIQSSWAEFSVAKDLYVSTMSGWFSERSACYLAAGRPVVVEDTGFSQFIPTGEGLFAFSSFQEAENALSEINSNYVLNSKAARDLAEGYFDAGKVLQEFLTKLKL